MTVSDVSSAEQRDLTPLVNRVLWIGGAQWAGKTTVAQLLAVRYGLVHYSYDYHDSRSHWDRGLANPSRYPHRASYPGPEVAWVRSTPEEMARTSLNYFVERFDMVLDDLLTLPGSTMIVAEGWGLRPELVLPLLRSPRQAIFLVPTDEFREHQIKMLPRAGALSAGLKLSDPERAQRNRLERDALIATDLMDSTQRLGLKVLEVDGSVSADGIARVVEEHFGEYLPRWLY